MILRIMYVLRSNIIFTKNVKDGWMIVYVLSKKKKNPEILSNLDQTRVWFKTTLFHNGYLQNNQDLVLHNLQADD